MNLDEALVQLARLGLKGDSASVRRLVQKLLRDFAPSNLVPVHTKRALAELIATQPSPVMRFAEPGTTANGSPYLRVELEVGGMDPLLPRLVETQLNEIVAEHQSRDRLETAGISPTRTVLFTGPPGVGKTMAARALTRRLGLPLMSIDLSALMSSYLGKTGQNLKEVFEAARSEASVLFLDEFDAVAKRRDDPSDVGELKRIVNVLLIELEARGPTGLVVAATNHPELLDRAIWRRFERTITLGLPVAEVRRALIEREMGRLQDRPSLDSLEIAVTATDGSSCSDIVVLARACVRRVVLETKDVSVVLTQESMERLRALALTDSSSRALYCQIASGRLGQTQRAIGIELGISHVMVGKLLRQSAGDSEHV